MKTLDHAPAAAMLMHGGAVTFAADKKTVNGADSYPITMLARSSQPIEHWYWGRVVHDLAGFSLHKDRIPVDYVHEEPIGYLDEFNVTADGLVVSGALVPTDEASDPARKLLARHRGGVPYEASIDFRGDGMKYEIVAEGQVAEVNGYQFEGPGIIIREWPLRGVAVCPYGADMNTESTFSRAAAESFSIFPINGEPMKTAANKAAKFTATDETKPDETTPPTTPPAETPAETTPEETPADAPPAETPAAAGELSAKDPRAEMRRFREAFGDAGLAFYADGLSFEAAQQKANATLVNRVEALEKKLAAAAQVTGEQTPAGFNAGDKRDAAKGFASKIRFTGQPLPAA